MMWHGLFAAAFAAAAIAAEAFAQDPDPPSMDADGDALTLSAGSISFRDASLTRVGPVTLAELVARLATVEQQLVDRDTRLLAAEAKIAELQKADTAAKTAAGKLGLGLADANGNIDVLESRVVEIGAIVSNMSDCDELGQHHTEGGVCQRSASWSCPPLVIPLGTSSITGKAFIGAVAEATCPTGLYLEGEPTVQCLGSGDAASGAHWGLSTGESHLPKCKRCRNECASCSDGTRCIKCKIATQIYSPGAGKCIENKAKSCKQLLDWGELDAELEENAIFKTVSKKLYPDIERRPDSAVDALCHVVKTPAGEIQAFTSIKCSALGSCIPLANTVDNNTCDQHGFIAGPYRSEEHYLALVASFGDTISRGSMIQGVSRATGGRSGTSDGRYTNCIMRDPNTYTSGCRDWTAVDGGAWWMRDTEWGDPGGDYCKNDLLNKQGGVHTLKGATPNCYNAEDNVELCAELTTAVDAQWNPCSEACVQRNPEKCRAAVWPMPAEEIAWCHANYVANGRAAREQMYHNPCSPSCPGVRPYDNALDWQDPGACKNRGRPLTTYICSTSDY